MGPLLAALWLGFASPPVDPAAASGSNPGPRSDARPTAARGRAIVFMLGEDQAQARAVVDAIESQLADLNARVEVEPLPHSEQLGARLQAARRHAGEHQAIGVFWLDVDPDGDLLLHLVDPQGERMLVRRVAPSPESDTAAVQTVAVIARGFTSALLEGRSIGMSRVEMPAASDDELPPLGPNETPTPGARTRGQLRVGAAYYGAHVAPQADWIWQSGLATSLAWQWPVGVYAGVGYDVTQRFVTVTASEPAMNTISSEVRRNPASALLGYQHRWPHRRLAIDGELRFIVDPHTVDNLEAVEGTIKRDDELSVFLLLSPRAALHFQPTTYFSADLGLGAEIVLSGVNFTAQFRDEATAEIVEEREYLSPAIFRPLVIAGITFYL